MAAVGKGIASRENLDETAGAWRNGIPPRLSAAGNAPPRSGVLLLRLGLHP